MLLSQEWPEKPAQLAQVIFFDDVGSHFLMINNVYINTNTQTGGIAIPQIGYHFSNIFFGELLDLTTTTTTQTTTFTISMPGYILYTTNNKVSSFSRPPK